MHNTDKSLNDSQTSQSSASDEADVNSITQHFPSKSDEMSLKDLIVIVKEWTNYLKSQWHIFLIVGIVGGAGGLAYAYFKKPLYIAETTFVLEDEKSGGMGNYAGLASQFGINMGMEGGQGVFEGENLLALMRSRLMMEKALMSAITIDGKVQTLIEFYIDINGLREEWVKKGSVLKDLHFPVNSNPSEFSKDQNSLLSSFHQSLINDYVIVEKLDKKSGIISLIVQSESELFAKYLSDALTKEVAEFYIETKTKKSSDNVKILQHQTDSVRRELNSSMVGMASSIDANPNPNMARQILRVTSQRKEGDVQINQAILVQLVQNLEIAKMSLRTETPLIQIIDSPIFPLKALAPSKPIQFIKWGVIACFITFLFILIRRFLTTL